MISIIEMAPLIKKTLGKKSICLSVFIRYFWNFHTRLRDNLYQRLSKLDKKLNRWVRFWLGEMHHNVFKNELICFSPENETICPCIRIKVFQNVDKMSKQLK